mgnify:CR=1 FL=1
MKKIIVTLCSLALSLAGTFGVSQLASNDDVIIDRYKEELNISQDVEAVEQADYADEAEVKESEKPEDKASEVEVASPKAEDLEDIATDKVKDKEDKNDTVKTNDKKDSKKSSNKKTNTKVNDTKVDDTKVNDTKVNNTNYKKADNKEVKDNNNNSIAANNKDSYTNSLKSNGKNVYVYKNVDLSNCNSIQDIVNELQKNGYKNINMNNIQNISSLEDILSTMPAPTKPASTKSATPTPTTPSKPEPTEQPKNNSGSNQGFAEEVLRLVNIERSKAGLSSLTTNATLKAAADKRAQETKVSFSHTRPNGSKFSTVLQEFGISYRTAGENIAYGQRSPQEVVNGWMNSPGHRANILNGSFGKIGIGVYQSGGVIYWTQLFTN